MALTNKGFNGTVTEADFAFMGRIGMAEGVESAGAWAVTQGTGRQTSTAAQVGWAFSAGVVSKDTAAILTSLGTPTNGQWYLIVRRINWATDTVSVVAIAHTTTSTTVPTAAPAGLPTMSATPGTEWDQKLAWAWVRSTDTTMYLVDLRNLPLEDRLANLALIPGLAAGAGRGGGANYTVTTPAALDAITNAVVGDTAWMTTPGTGIDPLNWIASAGSGTTIDWRPSTSVVAATKANLDSFISTVAAITDTVFQVGGLAVAAGIVYQFTSAAGVYKVFDTQAGRQQLDTTNSITGISTQFGHGKITGVSAAAVSETLNFPLAFAAPPAVMVNFIGQKVSGSFSLTGLTADSGSFASAQQPSASSVTIFVRNLTTLSAANDYYYSWIAIGVPA